MIVLFPLLLLQVLIFPSTKSSAAPCSANIFLHVIGSHGETPLIQVSFRTNRSSKRFIALALCFSQVPRGVIHFAFWCRNLGVITSLRLGHDNVGSNPGWLIEHVLVRNEFTGM